MTHEVNWPGWEVVEKIGAGSFGAVYRIRRDMLGEEEFAALKVISIPHTSDELEELQSQGYDDATITTHFQKYLEDIIKEYSLMRKIKGNTNVVYCDDIQYVPKESGFGWTIYIKMELLNPLMKNLHRVNSEAQVVKLAKDLCNALELCREQNIIHRDIKPQNVFISDHGSFKLGDFGIAKTVERTSQGTKIGTYKYMAPEVFHNRPYGHNADIYSLGLLLYWLLNEKRTPFLPAPPQIPSADMEDAAMMHRFRGEPIPAPAHGSPELTAVVLRACAADPEVRYQTAGQMLADLQKIVASTAPFTSAVASAVPEDDRTVAAVAAMPSYAEETEGTVSIFGRAPVVSVAPEAPAALVAPAPAVPKQKKSKKGLVILLLVALVAAIAVAGILLLPKLLNGTEQPDTQPSQQPTEPITTDPTGVPTEPTTTDPTDAPITSVKVPNVVGMTRQQAMKALEDLGLVVALEYEHNQQAEVDVVLSQSVNANTEVQSGSMVTLVICTGASTVSVPDVTGQKQDVATENMLSLGLKVTLSHEYSDTAPEGTVISQSHIVGSTCDIGTQVTLVISLGKDTIQSISVSSMPNHKYYLPKDMLNTEGLKLQATYASGKKATITSGFACNPMQLEHAGETKITVTYNGFSTNFTVEVLGPVAAYGSCGPDARWVLVTPTGTSQLIIFGVGEVNIENLGLTDTPWARLKSGVLEIIIKDGITAFTGQYLNFSEYPNLKSITMADSVVSLGTVSFSQAKNLETARLSNNLTAIPNYLFMNCQSLREVNIPETITLIGEAAFSGSKLTSITIPRNVTKIKQFAFAGCQSLTTLKILNPDCTFGDHVLYSVGSQVVVYGYAGSTAQQYAEANGHQFATIS